MYELAYVLQEEVDVDLAPAERVNANVLKRVLHLLNPISLI